MVILWKKRGWRVGIDLFCSHLISRRSLDRERQLDAITVKGRKRKCGNSKKEEINQNFSHKLHICVCVSSTWGHERCWVRARPLKHTRTWLEGGREGEQTRWLETKQRGYVVQTHPISLDFQTSQHPKWCLDTKQLLGTLKVEEHRRHTCSMLIKSLSTK